MTIEKKLDELSIYGSDNHALLREETMEAMYIGFVKKIHDKCGEEGFYFFVEKFKEAGGTARDFKFDSKNYQAFKYALSHIFVKYGRL